MHAFPTDVAVMFRSLQFPVETSGILTARASQAPDAHPRSALIINADTTITATTFFLQAFLLRRAIARC